MKEIWTNYKHIVISENVQKDIEKQLEKGEPYNKEIYADIEKETYDLILSQPSLRLQVLSFSQATMYRYLAFSLFFIFVKEKGL